jgi:hypothetical protein
MGDPFPARTVRELDYTQSLAIAGDGFGTTTSGSERFFRLNSCFAPSTSGGHQPYGFDQMMTLFRRFKVLKTRVEIHAVNVPTSNNPCIGIIRLSPPNSTLLTSTTSNAYNVFGEKPQCSIIFFPATPVVQVTKWVRNVDMAEICGLSRAEFDANVNDYAGTAALSPANIVTLGLNTANVSSAGDQAVQYFVNLRFTVEFFERNALAQS